MNYFKLISAFYDSQLTNPLPTGQIALWCALAHINNKCSWAEWFSAANQTLELLTGLSRQAINKNRNVLRQAGLIDFKANGGKACSYHIVDITLSNSLQDSLQESVQESFAKVSPEFRKSFAKVSPEFRSGCTLNNLNITKTELNKKEKYKKEKPGGGDTDFDKAVCEYTQNVELKEAISEYIKMRKIIKKPLTLRALKTNLKELDKLTSEDEMKIQILDQSISKCYLGVFPIRKNQGYERQVTDSAGNGTENSEPKSRLDGFTVVRTDEDIDNIWK